MPKKSILSLTLHRQFFEEIAIDEKDKSTEAKTLLEKALGRPRLRPDPFPQRLRERCARDARRSGVRAAVGTMSLSWGQVPRRTTLCWSPSVLLIIRPVLRHGSAWDRRHRNGRTTK